ncbi:ATP-binding protein [Phenylobacterium sp.]|uniref:ATP-binding response regulator n=1 Tax=Phenylobacterium sp. TaxID=1871053 RepID=UPI00374CBEF5
MISRRLAAVAAAALLLAASTAARAAAPETAPKPAPADAFDASVAAAKSAMMADPRAGLKGALAALDLAHSQAGNPKQAEHVATAQWLEASALLRLNRLDEAGPVIAQGLATAAARAPDSKLHGDLMMAQADYLGMTGDVQKALAGLQSAYRIFGKAKQPRSQAMALQYIGSIYQDAGDYAKVLEYYAQSADLYPADLALLIAAENNIGRALQFQKKYAEAAAEFEKALLIARKMHSTQLEIEVLTNLAASEVQWGRLDQAQRHLGESQRLAQSDPSGHDELPFIHGVAAQLQLARHQPKAAAQELAHTFQGVDLTASPAPFRDFHETAYQAFTALHDDPRALAHLRAFKRLDDQTRDLAASTTAALMSAQFDFANQKTRIAQLKAGELQRDVALARSRNVITTVLLIGSVMIALLLAVSFLSIRRSRNEVRAANGKLSQANTALEKALKARTEFLATTSHEIRTPLNGVLGMTQVILAGGALDADTRAKVTLVHGAAETMRALVDDILDMARIETDGVTLRASEFDLPQLCRETTNLWRERAAAKGLQVVLDAGAAPRRIVEDPGRLRQILFNLMSNAIKFTQAGSVTLCVTVEAGAEGETLVLAVADTGVGIPSEQLEEVFESFRQGDSSMTRSYEGTGLGLAICRRLAQAMGGDVALDSVVGRGTTVSVRVPLTRAEVPASDEIETAPRGLEGCRVLICDGNPMSQAVIKTVLQPVTRGIEAVDGWQAALVAGPEGRFDLILADAAALGAERQARLSALRELAAAAPNALIVVMTPEVSEDEAGRLLGAGADQIIKKPIAASALADALRQGFNSRAIVATGASDLVVSAR